MAQNIYDDADFFNGYSQLPRAAKGLGEAPEWPALQTQLPNLTGATVADLGCGFGWFCEWAANEGATSVTGFDVSERMLERARAEHGSPKVSYVQTDLATLKLDEGVFNLVYSCLALHYIEDLAPLFAEVAASLMSGGKFVFMVEHPIQSAPQFFGPVEDPEGRLAWPVEGYLNTGPRSRSWFTDGVVKHHRPVEEYVNGVLDCGLRLTRMIEWGPTDEEVALNNWVNESLRPPFLIVAATKS